LWYGHDTIVERKKIEPIKKNGLKSIIWFWDLGNYEN